MKRGDVSTTMLIWIVLGVLALAIGGYFLYEAKKIGDAGVPSFIELETQLAQCKIAGQTNPGAFADDDKDTYPDYCDPCLKGKDNKPAIDGDFIAEGCDNDVTKTASEPTCTNQISKAGDKYFQCEAK